MNPFRKTHLRVAALVVADVLGLVVAMVVAVAVCRCFAPVRLAPHAEAFLLAWAAFVSLNFLFGLYQGNPFRPRTTHARIDAFRRMFVAAIFSHLALLGVVCVTDVPHGVSRAVLVAAGPLTGFFAVGFRDAVRRFLHQRRIGVFRVAIVGNGASAAKVAEALSGDAFVGAEAVCLLPPETEADEIFRRAQAAGATQLVAIMPFAEASSRIDALVGQFDSVTVLPEASPIGLNAERAIRLGPFVGVEFSNRLDSRFYRVARRALDIAVALPLAIVFAPFGLAIALAVKATSSGPVFYRQERIGRFGRVFRVWKFRTMCRDAEARLASHLAAHPEARDEWERTQKLRRDPRITKVGRLLRMTSLDELPQLINVLCGEMSVVGPRPIVAEEIPRYGEHITQYTAIRPGITGLWQVSGRSDTSYGHRVELDCYYVSNWSPWMDLWILYRTAVAVVTMRGAV